jgi:zinc protease
MRVWVPSWFTACVCLSLLVCVRETPAQTLPVKGAIERYLLPNGLRVVLDSVPDRSSAAVCVTYLAGSGLEQERESGIASLVERLMSQGSCNVGPNDHARLLAERAAVFSNTTTEEVASYCTESLSSELPLIFWLEADRMGQLALNKESFERQKSLAVDEYRARFSHDVMRRGVNRLHELVFQRYWPYEHPTTGFWQDVQAAEYTQAKAFVSDYYSPDNAVISVVGTFDEANVRALIDQYFGALPRTARKPQLPTPVPHVLPRQTSERLSVVEQDRLTAPVVLYGWRIPEVTARENAAFELAAQILCNPQTGRLRADLLDTESLANDVSCSTYSLHDAGLFRVQVTLHRRSTVDAMQKALEKQLLALKLAGPNPADLERAKVALTARRMAEDEHMLDRSRALGQFEGMFGDPSLFDRQRGMYQAIGASDIRAAFAKYVLDTRRSIVEIYPHGWVRDIGPPVITKTYIVQPGDNLTRIAARYGTTPEQLAKQNGLAMSKRITVGQRLLITTNPAKIVKIVTHTVAKGQTLIAIGKKYGVSADDIAKANGLTKKKAIRPGQVLQIPPKPKTAAQDSKQAPAATVTPLQAGPKGAGANGSTKLSVDSPTQPKGETTKPGRAVATAAPAAKRAPKSSSDQPKASTPAAPAQRAYVVKAGDSLSVIAHKFKVSVTALARANGISQKKPIRPGQKLIIP